MILATRGGDGWLWYLCGFAVWVLGGNEREEVLVGACLATGVGLAVYQVVKKLTRRDRPCFIEAHCWAKMKPPDQYSFPSGHAITAFAVAVSIGLHYPGAAPLLLSLAALVGISRIFLGMHFLSDVIAGCFLGVSLAYGVHKLLVL